MVLLVECILACLIFSFIFVGGVLFHKESFLSEYSPEVQKRFLQMHPDYVPKEAAPVSAGLIVSKVGMCFVFLAILSTMVFYAGADSFLKGFLYSYLIWSVVNIYDVVILDLGVFMHWRKVRLPGTEEMDEAYRSNVWPSVKGGLYGILIGLPVCLLCGAVVSAFQ